MRDALDATVLRQRQETYLPNHYLSLHVTVVSLALGVAGVVAGSLLAGTPSAKFDGYQPIFYLLWLSSLLVIGVAYGGPMIGAFLLPARVPAVVDFLLPMLIAVCEFMLFTVLGYRIIQLTTPRAVLIGWWITLATFSLVALLQVRRAHNLISNASRSTAINDIVSYQLERLRSNMKGASIVTLLAASSAGYYVLIARPSLQCSYVLAAASIFVHAMGLTAHSKTARGLRRALAQMPEEPKTTDGNTPA